MVILRTALLHCLSVVVSSLSLLGFAWAIFGCASGVIPVVPSESTTFEQIVIAEHAADLRRPAHLMGMQIRGDSSDKLRVMEDSRLPEPYAADGERRVSSSHYHLAYAALRLLREHYAAAHPGYRALDLVEIVDAAGGNTYMVNDFDRDRQMDIADVEKRMLFEIVPSGQAHRAAGKNRVDFHLLLINKGMLGVPEFDLGKGYAGEIGVRFAEDAAPWRLSWSTNTPGVVEYEWLVLNAAEKTDDAYGEAYLDNRWRKPTRREIGRFGRALHEVIERKAGPRSRQ